MKRKILRNIARQEEVPQTLHSVDEAAALLNLSHWTIRGWIRDRKIATNKLGSRRMVPASEIQRIIEEGYQPAA